MYEHVLQRTSASAGPPHQAAGSQERAAQRSRFADRGRSHDPTDAAAGETHARPAIHIYRMRLARTRRGRPLRHAEHNIH